MDTHTHTGVTINKINSNIVTVVCLAYYIHAASLGRTTKFKFQRAITRYMSSDWTKLHFRQLLVRVKSGVVPNKEAQSITM